MDKILNMDWHLDSFMGVDPDFKDPELVIRHEELLALAYLKSCRDNVMKRGFSFLGSFDGRHRCLAKGDKVLMADGSWKNIEDIKCGDNVFSPQYDKDKAVSISKVVATHNHLEKEVYNVVEPKLTNRVLYTCSKDHKIPLIGIFNPRIHKPGEKEKRKQLRGYKEYTAEQISKIKRALQSRIVTFSTPQLDFGKPDSTIEPHCLGIWIGDGHCNYTHSVGHGLSHGLGITTNDKEITEVFNLKYPNEINSIGKKNGTTAVTLRITIKGKFFSELKRLNLVGTKSGTKFIPKECLLSSVPYRLKLLAGIIDTDGFVPKCNCTIEITTKSENLAKDILDLVCSLGGYGRITKIKKGIKSIGFIGKYFCVRFAFKAENIKPLADEVCVKMKKERLFKQILRYQTTNRNHIDYDPRHISIKCVRTNPQIVYGFTLDSPSGLFITNDWLVTHNSGKSLGASTFAYLWDPTFWPRFENRIVQDHKDFINEIEIIAKEGIKGGVIIVDEAGIAMSATDWYERWMKTITQMVQMFGYLCPVVLFVAPVKDFVDSRLRKMFHAYYKVERYTNEETTITPYHVKYNTVLNKWFYRKPIVNLAGQRITLRRIKLTCPPPFILDRYKNLEVQRKNDLFDRFLGEMKRSEIKEQKETVDIEKVIDYICKNYKLYENRRSKPTEILLDPNKIEFGFKITNRQALYIKNEAERKLADKLREIKEQIDRTGGKKKTEV